MLDPECLMAFPGMSVMRAADIQGSLKGAPRWASVQMTDRRISRPGGKMIVLGYTAEGRRDGAAPHPRFCTSTYRADGGT